VDRVETQQYAKFCQNWSVAFEDIKIFQFFKMAAAAILDFQICEILLADGVWVTQTHNCTKFRQNRSFHCVDKTYCDFSKFLNGQLCHYGFLKSQNFIGYWGGEG